MALLRHLRNDVALPALHALVGLAVVALVGYLRLTFTEPGKTVRAVHRGVRALGRLVLAMLRTSWRSPLSTILPRAITVEADH